ncbi:MAG: PilZ domain-containing protein [Pseudomonadota bacterium]
MSQTEQKIFISKNQTANISCSECKKNHIMDVSEFLGLKKAIRLTYKCLCGNTFPVLLERRKYVRKNVNFNGSLICGGKEYSCLIVDIVVMDISRYGLKVKLLKKLDLSVNQKIIINFELDDKNHSKISKEAFIRTINPPNIGVEFLYSEHYDKFGAYILFHFNNQ